jgi:hypothetical protein
MFLIGILEERIFEADPNIKFTFAWDRMNIYRQRVYGVTTANIMVSHPAFIDPLFIFGNTPTSVVININEKVCHLIWANFCVK